MDRVTSRLRLWMLGVPVVVVPTLEMIAAIDREGQPMGDRGDFRHGRDVHGHHRWRR